MSNETGASSKAWKSRIESCRQVRKKLVDGPWKENVAYRKLKPFKSTSDLDQQQDRVAVPIDWSYTKAKIASLFSQTPKVQLTPKNPQYAAAVPVFAKELNEVIQNEARVAVAIEEALADAVNACGIGAVMAGYTATFEDVEVPAIDISMLPPEQAKMLLVTKQVPMETVKRPVSEKFYTSRISPANLVWDASFKGSDFDDSSFLGHEGDLTWAQAKRAFNLNAADKEEICKAQDLSASTLSEDSEDRKDERICVHFTEIFYKAADFDPDELYLEKLRRIVFVEGLDKPVVHEDLQWQRFDEQTGQYVGLCRFPIRVLTLTYISDEAIPPSDSEIGRPQVDEMMRSRSQMIAQREGSIPIRWADPNRIDPVILENLQKGNWQGFIPINGGSAPAIGEVVRATYPPENWEFDRVTQTNLQESWQVGANQSGQFASGARSASEANIVQANFSTRIGFERGKAAKFFCGIAETLAGLMQLYYDKPNEVPVVGEQDAQRIAQSWDRSKVAGAKFVFSIIPDSSVLLDADQKVDRLMRFLNLTGKSGFVNIEPIIAEIAALSGMDPAQVMMKANPPQPESPNFSYRFSGAEDLTNPIVIAMLIKAGKAPSPDELRAAKELLADAVAPAQPQVASTPVPQNALPPMADSPTANPDWAAMPRVTKRPDELGG